MPDESGREEEDKDKWAQKWAEAKGAFADRISGPSGLSRLMKLVESILGHRVQIIGLRLKGKVVDFHTEDCAIVRWDAGYTSHIGARLLERID